MTFLSLTRLHQEIEEAGTIDALVSEVAKRLDCPMADARSYLLTVSSVALRGLSDVSEATLAGVSVGFVNGYEIGFKDGHRAS